MQSSTFMGVYIYRYIYSSTMTAWFLWICFFSPTLQGGELVSWSGECIFQVTSYSSKFHYIYISSFSLSRSRGLCCGILNVEIWAGDTHRICKKERRKQLQLGSPWVSFVQSPLLHLVKLSRNAKEFWGCNLILGHNKISWQHRVCIIRQLRCPETWRTECWSLSDVFLHLEIRKTFLDILIQTVCLHDKDVQRK